MLACLGMIELIKAQKIELIEEENQLSSGVRSHISGKSWSNHVFQNLQGGTKQKETKERLADEVSISHGQRRAWMSYWATHQRSMHHDTFSLKLDTVQLGHSWPKWGKRNPRVLVVEARRAVCRAPVYKVSEVEKTKEEACEKLKREKY